ncbi:MAG: hypothetical protein LQ340_000435 [Diploschistes diacapsis]|nr:MAG: hypothetical protein LQ340_000435 [Diploschistes diacapsis]
MPQSMDRDGRDIPDNVFKAEQTIFRFRSMPNQVEEQIIQNPHRNQEIIGALQEYRDYYSQQLGSEDAADDRLKNLCTEASRLQPLITERFNEAVRQVQAGEGENSDLQAILATLGNVEDGAEGGEANATVFGQDLLVEDIRHILGDTDYDLRPDGSSNSGPTHRDLLPRETGQIMGDNDHGLDANVDHQARARNQELSAEHLRRILGDDDYDIGRDVNDVAGMRNEVLSPEHLKRILGDEDYHLPGFGDRELSPEQVRRILGDGDYDVDREVDEATILAGQELSPENIKRILGDDDYDVERDIDSGPDPVNQELVPENIKQILGDNDFDLNEHDGHPKETGPLNLEALRRILGDDDFHLERKGGDDHRNPHE